MTRTVVPDVARNVDQLCPPRLDNPMRSTDKPVALADSDQAGIRRGILVAWGLDLEIGGETDPADSSVKRAIWPLAVCIAEQPDRSCPGFEYVGDY